MRSITFTSLVSICLAGTASAQDITRGCFERDYTAEHLASHPLQVVDDIKLRFYDDEYGNVLAEMLVLTANQGHVAKDGLGGQTFWQFLLCWDNGGLGGCSVECDGGGFDIEIDDGNTLQFVTQGLWVGETDECGGAANIAEVPPRYEGDEFIPGEPVSYRLYRTDDTACDF